MHAPWPSVAKCTLHVPPPSYSAHCATQRLTKCALSCSLAAADASAAASLVTGDQLKALVAACQVRHVHAVGCSAEQEAYDRSMLLYPQSGSAASRIKALKQLRRALMVDNEPPIQVLLRPLLTHTCICSYTILVHGTHNRRSLIWELCPC